MNEADIELARAAVQHQLITPDQLTEARAACEANGEPLGRVLLQMKLITVEQLAYFEQFQKQQDKAAPKAPSVHPELAKILAQAVKWGASDVHMHSGAKLKMRLAGYLRDIGEAPLDLDQTRAMLGSILSPEHRRVFEEVGAVDLAYTLPKVARFRINVYRQQRGYDGIFRVVPLEPPSLSELGLPEDFARFTEYHQGLVLVTGPSGCGKSATLAALVDLINERRPDHVLCIEDPIETVYPSKKATVNQRQVGRHTASFARGLRAALREDPDVIAIGELRDLETVSLALTAAETGHLVIATLHTESAVRTIDRLIGVFPPNQQAQIRTMISESLRVILSQRLVPTVDQKSRVPAVEVLIVNKAISNLIRDGRTFQIQDAMQIGAAAGMCLLDQSLTKLLEAGTVTREEAVRHANDPKKIGGRTR